MGYSTTLARIVRDEMVSMDFSLHFDGALVEEENPTWEHLLSRAILLKSLDPEALVTIVVDVPGMGGWPPPPGEGHPLPPGKPFEEGTW